MNRAITPNPSNYRKLSEPFVSNEEANAALTKFLKAVEDARNECHMMDVHVLVKVAVTSGDREIHGMSSAHFGNLLEGAQMCAWGLGQEQQLMADMLGEYVK